MPDQFSLSIELTGAPQFDALLRDVAGGVLQQAGYAPEAMEEILGGLRTTLAQNAVEGCRACRATFRREGGRLLIQVSFAGGREWHVTRPLPVPD